MRTIDEIGEEIRKNGYGGLSDEETEAWIKFKTETAAEQAKISAEVQATISAMTQQTEIHKQAAAALVNQFREVSAPQFEEVNNA